MDEENKQEHKITEHTCNRHGLYFTRGSASDHKCPDCQKDRDKGKRDVVGYCEVAGHGRWEVEESYSESLEMWMGFIACIKCDDWVKANNNAKLQKKEALEFKICRNTDAAGIPARFKNKTIEGFMADKNTQAEHCKIVCHRYADEFDEQVKLGRCLMLLGSIGTGKTHLAFGIANALLTKGYVVKQTTVNHLSLEVRSTYNKNSNLHESEVIRKYIVPDLLILDEVGIGRGTQAEKLIIHDVLSCRYNSGLPTVITSNLDKEALKLSVGERLYSRLQENGGLFLVFNLPDFRTKKS